METRTLVILSNTPFGRLGPANVAHNDKVVGGLFDIVHYVREITGMNACFSTCITDDLVVVVGPEFSDNYRPKDEDDVKELSTSLKKRGFPAKKLITVYREPEDVFRYQYMGKEFYSMRNAIVYAVCISATST